MMQWHRAAGEHERERSDGDDASHRGGIPWGRHRQRMVIFSSSPSDRQWVLKHPLAVCFRIVGVHHPRGVPRRLAIPLRTTERGQFPEHPDCNKAKHHSHLSSQLTAYAPRRTRVLASRRVFERAARLALAHSTMPTTNHTMVLESTIKREGHASNTEVKESSGGPQLRRDSRSDPRRARWA